MRAIKLSLPIVISICTLFLVLDTISAHVETPLSLTSKTDSLPAASTIQPDLGMLSPDRMLASLPRQQQVDTRLPQPADILITEFITQSGWRTPGLVPVSASASRGADIAVNPDPDNRDKHIVWSEQDGTVWYMRLGSDDSVKVPATSISQNLPPTFSSAPRIAVDSKTMPTSYLLDV